MTPRKKVKINKLHLMAMKLADAMTEEEEIRKHDITAIYYDEKEKMIAEGELINAQFNGLPGSGKSTAMIAEVFDTNIILKKKMTIDHIIPNQIVYSQVMKKIVKRMDVCVGIDEYDVLGETSYNASIEQAAIAHYSDLHRAHYIHKYACAPKDVMDKNCFLIFEILGMDKETKYTRCLLYYVLFRRGSELQQLLGYVDIDVSEVLNTEFYKQYDLRKMERLKLFSNYGIRHERDIFTAKIVVDAYEELRDLARHMKVEKHMAELKIDILARKHRVMNSILAANKSANDLLALLSYVQEQQKILQKVKKLKKISSNEAIQVLMKMHEHLSREETEAVKYWKNAAKLEELYLNKLVVS